MNAKELIEELRYYEDYVKELEEKHALLQAENARLRKNGKALADAVKEYREFDTHSTRAFGPVEDAMFEAEANWREACNE